MKDEGYLRGASHEPFILLPSCFTVSGSLRPLTQPFSLPPFALRVPSVKLLQRFVVPTFARGERLVRMHVAFASPIVPENSHRRASYKGRVLSSRRICMTAVRRLMLLTCAVAAIPLLAQTSGGKKTAKPAPSPVPAAEAAQIETAGSPAASEVPTSTPPVTADTDQDLTNPRALKLSLDNAVRTSITQNLGVDLTRYDYRESA